MLSASDLLKCGNENEATVACVGQGSCGAVSKLSSGNQDFPTVLQVGARAAGSDLGYFRSLAVAV